MTESSPNGQPTYLIDSSIYIFRAWFSLPDSIKNAAGEPANAVYGFCHFVMQLLGEHPVERAVFAFDQSTTEAFRNEIYPPYKANRDPAPEGLKPQFQHCRDLISCLGYPALSSSTHEADDLIGSMVHKERKQNRPAVIVSGDKDLTQLVSEGDYWWDYAKNAKLNRQGIHTKLGVYPEQVADMLAIVGDPVDNIPGVQGIGSTTANKLLEHFETFDALFENLSHVSDLNIRGAKRIEALLNEYRETAYLSRRLTIIDCNLELPDYQKAPANIEDLQHLLQSFKFSPTRIKQWLNFAENLPS